MERVVTHPRHICGLLSEIDAERIIVLVKSTNEKSTAIYETLLKFNPEKKFRNSTFRLLDIGETSGDLYCEAILEGWRISFRCSQDSNNNKIDLPEILTLNDHRGDKRISFNNTEYPAEIRYPGGVVIGFAKDISRDYVSIMVEEFNSDKDIDLEYEVLVRNVLGNTDIFHRKLEFYNSVKTNEGTKLVFRSLNSSRKKGDETKRAKRHEIPKYRFSFQSEAFSDDPYHGVLEINNVSVTGFSAFSPKAGQDRKLLKGLLLHNSNSKIKFYMVRDDENLYGFKIHPSSINSWSKMVESLVEQDTTSIIGSKDLSKIFSTSTYLSNHRRNMYGREVSPHIAHSGQTNSILCRRLANADKMGEISDHVSAFRFSDHVWMIQEGAGGITSEGYTLELIKKLVEKLIDGFDNDVCRARYLMAQFSPKLPTITKFWHRYAEQSCNVVIKGYHIGNLNFLTKNLAESCAFQCTSKMSPTEQRNFSEGFNSLLLALVDYWNPSKNNPIVNKALSTYGTAHNTKLQYIETTETKALVYRFHSYYSSNTTGMLTGIYLIFPAETPVEKMKSVIPIIQSNNQLMKGTKDIVIFSCNELKLKENGTKADEFDCIIIDQSKSES